MTRIYLESPSVAQDAASPARNHTQTPSVKDTRFGKKKGRHVGSEGVVVAAVTVGQTHLKCRKSHLLSCMANGRRYSQFLRLHPGSADSPNRQPAATRALPRGVLERCSRRGLVLSNTEKDKRRRQRQPGKLLAGTAPYLW